MTIDSTTRRVIISIAVLLLLIGTGYVTVSGISSLDTLEQTLSAIETAVADAQISVTSSISQTEVSSTSPVSPTEVADTPPVSPTQESETELLPREDIEVLFPAANSTFVMSDDDPQVQVLLTMVPTHPRSSSVQVRLVVQSRVKAGGTEEPMGLWMTSTTSADLRPEVQKAVTLAFDDQAIPPTGTYKGWLVITSDSGDLKPFSQAITLEVAHPGDVYEVLFPRDDEMLTINSGNPQVQVRLVSREDAKDVRVQLLIAKEQKADQSGQTLSPWVASAATTNTDLTAGQPKSMSLTFEGKDLPSSGTYAGWLQVTAPNRTPFSRRVTYEVSRPSLVVEHRMSKEKDKTIVIGGVRQWPLAWVPESWRKDTDRIDWENLVDWEEYSLFLWEQDLRPVDYVLFPSELVDVANGRAGLLQVLTRTGRIEASQPSAVTLDIKNIQYPGKYSGSLTIKLPDGGYSETLNITAYVRDSLWGPFLVIFAGAFAIGWLIRIGAFQVKDSVPFHRLLIAMARQRLAHISVCTGDSPNAKCATIRGDLTRAESALDLGDVKGAAGYLQKVEQGLAELNAARVKLDVAIHTYEKQLEELKVRYEKLGDDKVIEAHKPAKKHLDEAKFFYARGKLSEMNLQLTDMNASLAQAIATLKLLEKQRLEKSRSATSQYEIRIEPPGHPQDVLYTDDKEIVFAVFERDSDSKLTIQGLRFEAEWVKPRWGKGLVTKTQNGSFSFEAACDEDYPRRCKVEAWIPGITEPIVAEYQVRHPFEIRLPVEASAGLPVRLELVPVRQAGQPSKKFEWHVGRDGKECKLYPSEGDTTWLYTPPTRGEYRIAVKQGGKYVASSALQVTENPVEVARRKLKWNAGLAIVAWAAVAAVSGLIYIWARVPTFGSPQDYLIALAWGLGLSTTVAPKEGVINGILKAFGITPKPATDADKVKVPDVVKDGKSVTKEQAEKQLKEKGMKAKSDPSNAENNWIVAGQKPAKDQQVSKGSEVTITLKEPVRVPDVMGDCKSRTRAQAQDALDKAGLKWKWNSSTPPSAAAWIVKYQAPAPGMVVPKDWEVAVTVEKP